MQPNSPNQPPEKDGIPQVTPREAQAKQAEGAQLVDVREPNEWSAGHIAGATLIPLGALGARVGELDRSREHVLVCRSGNRSQTAARILRESGFGQVENMAGGMLEWERQNLPVER